MPTMVNFHRRAFLALIPSVSVVGPRTLLKLGEPSELTGSFRDIPAQFIHPDKSVIHTLGYSASGDSGHATYVSDQLATPALTALAPRFCAVSADGRHWRAAVNSDGLVPVSAGGAIGTISAKLTGSGNQQPTIAQALAYQRAIGASGLLFSDGNYNIWCPRRTALDDNINVDKSGIPFLIRGPTILQSGPKGTTFNRRKFDGSDPAIFWGTQYLPYNSARSGRGIYWRGGMFMLVGLPNPRPQYAALTTLHLKGNWNINGGISKSASPGLVSDGIYYGLNSDGSGWDITDKPIWAENDRNTGDIIFEGDITVGGFRGELLYQGGVTHGSIFQTGTLTMHDTDGDGFNPAPSFSNGTSDGFGTIQMQSLSITNAFQALEGATGWNSNVLSLTIESCNQGGGLMAGVWGATVQPSNRPPPVFTVGSLTVGQSNWCAALRGNNIKYVNCTDTSFWIGQYNLYTSDVNITSLEIIANLSNLSDGLVFFSSGQNNDGNSTKNNRVGTVTVAQSRNAQLENYGVIDPVDWFGLFGAGNVIDKLTGVAWESPFTRNQAGVFGQSPEISQVDLKYLTH